MENKPKISLKRMLAIGTFLCLVLMILRVCYTSSLQLAFLSWNLFLAWIPLLISGYILRLSIKPARAWIIGILFFTWLLFFPNAPYIITDLFHLHKQKNIPLWFDLVLIVSCAQNGLIVGFVSLLEIQHVIRVKSGQFISWLIVILILFMSSFGVYLGRYERWNSWDVIASPVSLTKDIVLMIINPLSNPQAIGVTIFFAIFLVISYLTIYYLIRTKSYE